MRNYKRTRVLLRPYLFPFLLDSSHVSSPTPRGRSGEPPQAARDDVTAIIHSMAVIDEKKAALRRCNDSQPLIVCVLSFFYILWLLRGTLRDFEGLGFRYERADRQCALIFGYSNPRCPKDPLAPHFLQM